MILQVEEDNSDFEDANENQVVTGEDKQLELHLPFNALRGATCVGTIKFIGHIGKMPIQILVDGGNGNSLSPEGSISELGVAVQKIPVYLLPIVGANLILGANELSIKFFDKDKFVTLQGERSQVPQQAQLHHMRRLDQTNAIEACFAIHRAEPITKQDCWLELPTDMEPKLVLLLNRFKEVFHKPTGLPPPRLQNHTIPLMEGKGPVKVRPYRYPQSQKEQIEIMIQEMLTEGIIQ
ncbi:hypothetical protein A2U01_0027330, partial [Trifolium medium]|nr:hypothetical protein [Trifolium medium]